jgi:hypothetical protein
VFKPVNGVLTGALRDQRDFFGSAMNVGFDINSSGSASGVFKGSFGADFGAPIGYVHFSGVNLGYHSSAAPLPIHRAGPRDWKRFPAPVRFGWRRGVPPPVRREHRFGDDLPVIFVTRNPSENQTE